MHMHTHMHMHMHMHVRISEMSHLDAKAGRRLAEHLAEGGGGAGVYDRLQQIAREETRSAATHNCG